MSAVGPFCARRREARARAVAIVAAAQAAQLARDRQECTDRAIARLWRVRCHKSVGALLGGARAITLGDVLALPPELAREVLARALAALEQAPGPGVEETLDDLVVAVGAAMGELRADRRDGVVDHHAEHAARLARIVAIAARGQAAAAARAGDVDAGDAHRRAA